MGSNLAREHINQYIELMDLHLSAYEHYAKRHGLTSKELFVLYMLWCFQDGCLQSDLCEQLSISKQTTNAIVTKFLKGGYLYLTESEKDRRNKIIRMTEAGRQYARRIICPLLEAEDAAMAVLSDCDQEELIRLTTLITQSIQDKIGGIVLEG